MKKPVKIIIEVVLLVVIAGLVYGIYSSIMEPVNFEKQRSYREEIAIQRLKDVRTLQVAFLGEKGHYAATVDSLMNFYNNEDMVVTLSIGSPDDSASVAHTDAVKKANRRITNEQLYAMYLAGDKNLVFSIDNKIPVKDTLFNDREDFSIDSLKYIPFSGDTLIITSTVKTVSGVPVPLFEAKMPYKSLLKGLDNQLRINLDDERRTQNRYEGLQVGSINAPNNNAGNWE